jgi:YVTN family beta-propeller protein
MRFARFTGSPCRGASRASGVFSRPRCSGTVADGANRAAAPPWRLFATALAVALATGCGSDGGNESPRRPVGAAASLEFASPASITSPSTVDIKVGGVPGEIAVADGGVWATINRNEKDSEVVRIDPATNRVAATVPVEGNPFELAAGEGSVWVTGNFADGGDLLHRIDPETNEVVATLSFPGSYAQPLAAGEGSAWLLLTDRSERSVSLARIDPESNAVAAKVPIALGREVSYVDGLIAAHGSVWILALGRGAGGYEGPGDVLRFDPESSRVEATIPAEALSMGAGPGGLWVSGCVDCDEHRDSYFAQEIDTDTNAPTGPRIAVGEVGFGPLFVADDSVWFSGYGREEDTIAFRVDPDKHGIEEFLSVGDFYHSGTAFDAERQAIWIARSAPASVVRVDLDAGAE